MLSPSWLDRGLLLGRSRNERRQAGWGCNRSLRGPKGLVGKASVWSWPVESGQTVSAAHLEGQPLLSSTECGHTGTWTEGGQSANFSREVRHFSLYVKSLDS